MIPQRIVASNRRESLRYSFIERSRRDFDGVRDTVHVLDRDAT